METNLELCVKDFEQNIYEFQAKFVSLFGPQFQKIDFYQEIFKELNEKIAKQEKTLTNNSNRIKSQSNRSRKQKRIISDQTEVIKNLRKQLNNSDLKNNVYTQFYKQRYDSEHPTNISIIGEEFGLSGKEMNDYLEEFGVIERISWDTWKLTDEYIDQEQYLVFYQPFTKRDGSEIVYMKWLKPGRELIYEMFANHGIFRNVENYHLEESMKEMNDFSEICTEIINECSYLGWKDGIILKLKEVADYLGYESIEEAIDQLPEEFLITIEDAPEGKVIKETYIEVDGLWYLIMRGHSSICEQYQQMIFYDQLSCAFHQCDVLRNSI